MTLSGPAFFSIIFIVALVCLVIGVYAGSETGKWVFCADELPPDNGRIISNYPVAFFDDEFGIVTDQAEYHPHRANKWLAVPDGHPCHPFAWYDLPSPPHPRIPQDVPPRNAIENYI